MIKNFKNIFNLTAHTLSLVAGIGLLFGTYVLINLVSPVSLTNQTNVLGVKSESVVQYIPENNDKTAIVSNVSIQGNTKLTDNITYSLALTNLEQTEYSIPVVKIKNISEKPNKIKIVPSFSLEGDHTSISLRFNGTEFPLIERSGKINVPEIQLDSSSISNVEIIITTYEQINLPTTLDLSFVRIE